MKQGVTMMGWERALMVCPCGGSGPNHAPSMCSFNKKIGFMVSLYFMSSYFMSFFKFCLSEIVCGKHAFVVLTGIRTMTAANN